MQVSGNAMSGGPLSGSGVPLPTTPASRPGSDIISRLEAAHARVSPIGAPRDGEAVAYVVTHSTAKSRKGPGQRFDRIEIAARFRRGQSIRVIAEQLGCTRATIYQALRDQGIEPTNRRTEDGAA